jgi:hypothetical protein
MVNMEFSLWSVKMMSVLGLVMGVSAISASQNNLPLATINFNPLIYGILAIGIGTVIVIWFIHEMEVSHYP